VTRVKVCCIQDVEEMALAVRNGASALGLVSRMPSGPGVLEEAAIRGIASVVPPGVTSVLLTAARDPETIVAQQRRCGTNALQLVDIVDLQILGELRRALPGIPLVQVVHVTGPESIEQATRAAEHVHALLLDSGRPDGPIKQLGGTGKTHDWAVSRAICAAVPVPVYLAGGLTPGNVARAIREVRPFGVDVCSGLRTDGRLVEERLVGFMHNVRTADAG
jgi:phosphoribosylanthranilate isomerase